ncbi:MAG TPA: CBS domain-containing protein, partial [Thermoanaerobaculia bacterium]|nr:CBS domain-containing protein [Thermoanaerobaculia bacterium]
MSATDALEDKSMRPASQIPMRDVMSREVIAVRDDMTLEEVATFLTENQISGAPVEDAEGRPVGVVSLADVERATSEQSRLETEGPPAELFSSTAGGDYYVRGWERNLTVEELGSVTVDAPELLVGEIMTPRIHSMEEGTPVAEAARMMREAH